MCRSPRASAPALPASRRCGVVAWPSPASSRRPFQGRRGPRPPASGRRGPAPRTPARTGIALPRPAARIRGRCSDAPAGRCAGSLSAARRGISQTEHSSNRSTCADRRRSDASPPASEVAVAASTIQPIVAISRSLPRPFRRRRRPAPRTWFWSVRRTRRAAPETRVPRDGTPAGAVSFDPLQASPPARIANQPRSLLRRLSNPPMSLIFLPNRHRLGSVSPSGSKIAGYSLPRRPNRAPNSTPASNRHRIGRDFRRNACRLRVGA